MFSSLKAKIFLAVYIVVLISIPIGSYLVSQQQIFTSKAAPPKKTPATIQTPPPAGEPSPKSSPKPVTSSASPAAGETGTTTSFGPTLSGKVLLEGRPVENQAGKLFVGILESLVNNPTFLLSFTVDLPASGEFANLSLAGLLSGRNYYAILKGGAQIATSSAFTLSPTVTRLNNAASLNLLSGDLNDDNAVTAADFDLAKASFSREGLADLNKDGVVNLLDLSIIQKNIGKVGATGVWVSPQPPSTSSLRGDSVEPGQAPSGGYWIFVPNLDK